MGNNATVWDEKASASTTAPDQSSQKKRQETVPFKVVLTVILAGLIAVILYTISPYSCGDSSSGRWYGGLGVGLLTAGAALCFGGFFGFLFGVPRTPGQQNSPSVTPTSTSTTTTPTSTPNPVPAGASGTVVGAGNSVSQSTSFQSKTRPNTNLEEISDWLTKILVGAGLTQLNKIPGKLGQLSEFIAKGFGENNGQNQVFAIATIMFFGICGFLAVFLWTRMCLPELLDGNTLAELLKKDEEQQKKIDENQKKIEENQLRSDENANNVKKFLVEKSAEMMANPHASEVEGLNKARPELEAATRYVQNQNPADYTPTDYTVLAYDAYRKKDYQMAAENAEKALKLNPPKEMLWKIYNFLGLCYNYQQPSNWKPGDDTAWLDSAIKSYQMAIASQNSLDEELLAKANISYVYLNAERYDDCVKTVADILAKGTTGGDQMASICDLARIAGAAAKTMLNDLPGAADLLNGIKNIAAFGYLFNPDDLPAAALKLFPTLPGLRADISAFVAKVVVTLKL